MRSQTTVRSTQVLVMFLMLSAMAAPATAQTIGVRAGVSVDPEQFYFGAHAETPPLADRLRFRPNVEIGLGNDMTIAAFNVEFAYHFRSTEPWNVYAGGGPALNAIKRGRDTDTEPGINMFVGVAHEDGLFAEFKVGALVAMYGFGNANSIEQLGQQVLKFDQNEVVDRRRVRNDDHREPR